jgi:CheY-like chemotaxis protein
MEKTSVLLLVEDEALIRDSMAAVLEDGGFTVVQADGGEAAISQLDGENDFSGVITDIRMGAGTTGWEVARHARHAYPTIAIVYLSGDSAADWGSEGVPNSMMLQKPFASAQLLTAISTLLNANDSNLSQPPQPGQ